MLETGNWLHTSRPTPSTARAGTVAAGLNLVCVCVRARAHHDIDIDVDRVWCDSQRPLTLPPQQRYAPPHRLATGSIPSVPHVTALIPPPSSHPGSSQQVAPPLRLGFGSPQNEKERSCSQSPANRCTSPSASCSATQPRATLPILPNRWPATFRAVRVYVRVV